MKRTLSVPQESAPSSNQIEEAIFSIQDAKKGITHWALFTSHTNAKKITMEALGKEAGDPAVVEAMETLWREL